MNISTHLFSPAPLRDRVADWLRVIGTWLMQLANRISPQKRHHRGEAPMFGGPALTLPTDLEIAFGGIKAAILQKLLEWINVNERKGQTLLDGHHWTYISYNKLQKDHFPTRHPDTLRKYIREMERDGFIISCRPDPTDEKWYRLDMKAISKAVQRVGQTPRGAGQRSTGVGQAPTPRGSIAHPITSKTIKSKPQTKNTKPPTAAASESNTSTEIDVLTEADTDAAAAIPLPHPTIQAESGEYSIKAEAPIAEREDRHGEPTPVNATAKDQPTTTASSPKIPLKGSSPALADELRVGFKMMPVTSLPLIEKYGEDKIRAAMYKTRLKPRENPAGFLITVLREDDLSADLEPVQKLLHDMPTRFIPPADFVCTEEEREEISLIGFDRFVALQQAAEQAILEFDIPAVPEASDPDALHNLRTDGALV